MGRTALEILAAVGEPEDAADLDVFQMDDEPIQPRGWLLGNVFCRSYLSSIIADGGAGKTALRIAQCLALATGREFTGEHVFKRCRVLLVSLEDDKNELRRRVRAAMKHHGVDRSELDGWLFLAAPGGRAGKLMRTDKNGRTVAGALPAALEKEIRDKKIDFVCLDPFVKAHALDENSNNDIDSVMQLLSDLASTHNIGADVPHHVNKMSGGAGDANRGRGASAMKDAARLVYTLTAMSEDDAGKFSVQEGERRQLVRMDSAKVNLAPASAAKWFKLVGVKLDNDTADYPNGDNVHTVEPWFPPDIWEGLDVPMQNRILTEIDAGMDFGARYSSHHNATDRAAWKVIQKHVPDKDEAAAKNVIATWVKSGLLFNKEYFNPVDRKEQQGLHVDDGKRPK